MQFKILFVLMGGLSIANAVSVKQIEEDLVQFLKDGKGNPIDSNEHHLQLLNERIGFSRDALLWKGRFDGHQDVAIKISKNQSYTDQETASYRAAYAVNNPDIETKGIPNIYYTGHIFQKYPVIIMTLFEETLFDRWLKQNESFNAYSTLEVFLQLAKTLNYLQSRGVMHNDIKPNNIFLRGNEVFLGDFDLATFNGIQTQHGSAKFASSGYWNGLRRGMRRGFVDDLESLVYTIWYIENIHYNEPSGMTIAYNKNNERFVLEKCEHFKNLPRSFEAFKFICYNEMLSRKPNIDYNSIVNQLTAAIVEVKQITRQTNFEWLGLPSSASPLSFGYPNEDKPRGMENPDWIY